MVDSQVHIWAASTPERPWSAGGEPQRSVPVPPGWEGSRNDLALAAARAMRVMVVLACALGCTHAAGQFPVKPIRLIIPYPPGGGTDAVARPVAAAFTRAWGQQVVVDARGGGGGVIAAQIVANSAPDGYTLFLSTGGQMVSGPLVMGKVPYDPHTDFRPVSLATLLPAFLVTQGSSPTSTVQEVIAAARAAPGKLTFGSSGTGGGHHLAIEMLMAHSGVKIVHVPYKGGGPAMTALLSNEVNYTFSNFPAVRAHVQSGRMKIIASCGPKRTALAPQAPTFVESGMANFQYVTWYGFHYPARVPDAIVKQVNAELHRALGDRATAEALLLQGAEVSPSTPEAVTRMMREEHVRWSKVIQTQKLTF